MSCVPGGYESDSDDDLDDLVYGDDPLRKARESSADVSISVSRNTSVSGVSVEPSNQYAEFDWGEEIADVNRRTFLVPQSPNGSVGSRQGVGPPSPGALVLDDIRMAVMNGNINFLKAHLENNSGFFVDAVLKSGWTSLMYAASCAKPDILRYLLEYKADANYRRDMFTPLMAACTSSSQDEEKLVECVNLLIEHGANINATDRFLNNALMHACRKGKLRVAKELISSGSEINRWDGNGFTVSSRQPPLNYLISY